MRCNLPAIPAGQAPELEKRTRRSGRELLGLAGFQLVERMDVGLRACHERVRIGGPANRHDALPLQPNADLCLGIGAAGHGMDLEEVELGIMIDDLADRIEDGINRTVAGTACLAKFTIDPHTQFRLLRAHRPCDDTQLVEGNTLAHRRQLVVNQGEDVVVEDMLLAVGEILEPAKRFVQRVLVEFVAETGELVPERISPRKPGAWCMW